MVDMKEQAEYLASQGMAVFPVIPADKRPAVEWRDWATTDRDKISDYWSAKPDSNIGVATGSASDLVVVDVDDPALFGELDLTLPTTLLSDTAKGFHLWFRPPNGRQLRNTVRPDWGFDIRGDGGYVVAPPSLHPSGQRYRWDKWVEPVAFPTVVLDLLNKRDEQPTPAPQPDVEVSDRFGQHILEQERARVLAASEGERNNILFEAACNVFEVTKGEHLDRDRAWQHLLASGRAVGLPDGEVDTVLEGAWERVQPRHPKTELRSAHLSGADQMVPVVQAQERHDGHEAERRGAGTGLRHLALSELETLPPLRYLLPDRLPEGQTWLVGQPGVGKSFIALDWVLTYTAITGAPVLYYVGEGLSGMPGRIRAWQQAHDHVTVDNLTVVAGCPQLRDGPSPIASDWQDSGAPALVVVDTFARAFVGGDENSATDVGEAIHTMGSLTERFGCSWLILHHTNAGGHKPRGSTAIVGAAESIWMVEEQEGDLNSFDLKCMKLKDGERPKKQPGRRVKYGDSVAVVPSVLDQLGYGKPVV